MHFTRVLLVKNQIRWGPHTPRNNAHAIRKAPTFPCPSRIAHGVAVYYIFCHAAISWRREQKRNQRTITKRQRRGVSKQISHWILQSRSTQRSCHLVLFSSRSIFCGDGRSSRSLCSSVSFRGERSGFRAYYLVVSLIFACFLGAAAFGK